jgi:acetylxylan esterase
MYLYVPNSLRPDPAILVAAHECAENGPAFYETTGFSTLADEYGFIVIYPSASQPGGCWDTSSGGMMAAVMLGDYPDVFAAGAIFMGVPFGCNLACTSIPTQMSPGEWGAVARNADPGYHGPRPRVQIWHGTADTHVLYVNFGQEINQWTDVLGLSQTPLATDHPEPAWTRTVYGPNKNDIEVEAYSIQGAGHYLPEAGMEAYVTQFFGLSPGPSAGPGHS